MSKISMVHIHKNNSKKMKCFYGFSEFFIFFVFFCIVECSRLNDDLIGLPNGSSVP